MTLLVLDLRNPTHELIHSEQDFLHALVALFPQFDTYVGKGRVRGPTIGPDAVGVSMTWSDHDLNGSLQLQRRRENLVAAQQMG
jgi:hypothetical protein